MDICNQVALVTGGASGLGQAVASRLAARGARVVIADRDASRGIAVATALGGNTLFAHTDVTRPSDVARAIEQAEALGALRAVVHTAGIARVGRTLGKDGTPHDLEMFRQTIEINLIGSFNVMRLAAQAMARLTPANTDGERGVIIHTASVAAYDGKIGQVAYAAAKGGVVSMVLPAARDLGVVGIRVLAVAPGAMDTPMLTLLPGPARQELAAQIPFPSRLGQPDEFAALVEHLIENRYMNGEVVRLSGALRMPPK